MPKDHWQKAKDQATARQAAAEYAEFGDRSSYPYSFSDDALGGAIDAPSPAEPKETSKGKREPAQANRSRPPKSLLANGRSKQKAKPARTNPPRGKIAAKTKKQAIAKARAARSHQRQRPPLAVPAIIKFPANKLHEVKNGQKYQEADGGWVLATKRGMVIETFATEFQLDAWWLNFHLRLGRQPKALAKGRSRACPNRPQTKMVREVKHLASPNGDRVGSDYLKPLSREYDMPEYDLE